MALPAFDLAIVRDDLGIIGTVNDAWLNRRIAAIWAAIENYTHRSLGPVTEYIDDWARLVESGDTFIAPPYPPSRKVSHYLNNFPVTEIVSGTFNGTVVSLPEMYVDYKTGLVQSFTGISGLYDLGRVLVSNSAKVRYKAGFATIPPDIYEVVISVLKTFWSTRKLEISSGGVGGGMASIINVTDVGSVEFSHAPGSAYEIALLKGKDIDPILGPFSSVLDHYRDFRQILGGVARPFTTVLP